MSVIDLGAARFNAAKDASQVTVRDTLAEALRRIESGQWDAESVIVVGLNVEPQGGGTAMEIMHGGQATTNERLGMLARSTDLMIRNMCGEWGVDA